MWALTCTIRHAGREDTEYQPCESAGLQLNTEVLDRTGIVSRVRLTVSARGTEDFLGILHFQLTVKARDPRFFIPGFLYGRNGGDMPSSGRKAFPRIREKAEHMPESAWWMTRSDRPAEPMSLVYDCGRILAVAADPYPGGSFSGFTCSLNADGTASVGYTLGYENAPWLFVQTARVLERAPVTKENSVFLRAGSELSVLLYVYSYEGSSETAILQALEDVYFRYHQPPRAIPGMDPGAAVSLLTGAVRDNAWLPEEGMYSGFVYDRQEGHTYNKLPSLSWTNGFSVAVPMLMGANRLSDRKAREQALLFIRNTLQTCMNPRSGLPYDALTTVRGWWYDGMHSGGHSGYIVGQALYYLLKAYESERQDRGVLHDDWLDFVRPVLRRLDGLRNSDGEYPFAMSESTGAGTEYDSMGSAWCLAATALYCVLTGDREYLPAMVRSEQHYYTHYIERMECYGGPLDTDKAVDSEGVLAYIRAVRYLHELTGESSFLVHMRDALAYESTFKLGWNTPIAHRPLSTIGWSSCGGSITSVANPHIHPMSSTIIDEMRYYLARRPDAYIESRLADTIGWSLQTFNTASKEYGYGGPGWMSERFCFCQGLLTEHYPDGETASTWFALMPWAAASIIEGLAGLIPPIPEQEK